MKSLSFLMVVLLFPGMLLSQGIESSRDETSGENIYSTAWLGLDIGLNDLQYFKFQKSDNGKVVLKIKAVLTPGNSLIPFQVRKDSELWIRLANSEVIQVNAQNSVRGTGKLVLTGGEPNGTTITYEGIDKECLKKLMDNEVTKIRVFTAQGHFDARIMKESARRFKEAAKMISEVVTGK